MKSSLSDAMNSDLNADVMFLKKAFKEMPLATAFLMILDLDDKCRIIQIFGQ
jgi:hypothetical protein